MILRLLDSLKYELKLKKFASTISRTKNEQFPEIF